jgi:hypothetical protein
VLASLSLLAPILQSWLEPRVNQARMSVWARFWFTPSFASHCTLNLLFTEMDDHLASATSTKVWSPPEKNSKPAQLNG